MHSSIIIIIMIIIIMIIIGKIALVNRGTCTFVSKTQRCQDAGALMVVIINVNGSALIMARMQAHARAHMRRRTNARTHARTHAHTRTYARTHARRVALVRICASRPFRSR